MIKMYNIMLSKISVLKAAAEFFALEDIEQPYIPSTNKEPLLSSNQVRFAYFGGTVLREDILRFKKFIFRATRGKAYVKFYDLNVANEDLLKGETRLLERVCYICMYEDGTSLRQRIQKLLGSFNEPLYLLY